MDRTQWLLALHVTGAFLLLGGAVFASVFAALLLRTERPSDIAVLLRLGRAAVIALSAGELLAYVLGLWLAHHRGYSFGAFWIVASLVLLVVVSITSKKGAKRDRVTREHAEELAQAGDEPSPELRARLRAPIGLALSWGTTGALLVILALMIWQPEQ
ncbi:MAG: DUF2269 family protein [Actinomycetes bacterium]